MADTVQGKTVDFGMVMQRVRVAMSQLPDIRRGKNVQYSVADAGLSALSVFFMQCPSFLEFQRRMQQTQGHNNAQTLFGVHAIPCDNQIRHLLDAVPPDTLEPLYEELLQCLMREGVVQGYRTLNNKVLLALMRIAAEVISCSGGFWSACWSDVIARMVAVPMPNAAFERQLAAKNGRTPIQHDCCSIGGFTLKPAEQPS